MASRNTQGRAAAHKAFIVGARYTTHREDKKHTVAVVEYLGCGMFRHGEDIMKFQIRACTQPRMECAIRFGYEAFWSTDLILMPKTENER